MARKTDRQLLDEALREQEAGTWVPPEVSARRFLNEHADNPEVPTTPWNEGMENASVEARNLKMLSASPTAEEGRLQGHERLGQTGSAAVTGAALPLALLGGPVTSMAAGGALTALQGAEANADGNFGPMDALMAVAGALPILNQGRKALGFGGKAAAKVAGTVDRWMPNTSAASHAVDSTNDAMTGLDDVVMRGADQYQPASMGAASEVIPEAKVAARWPERGSERVPGLQDHFAEGFADVHRAKGSAPEGALPGGRRGDMHLAQTTGGEFGFDDLPKLSERELKRLQGLFKTVTGR